MQSIIVQQGSKILVNKIYKGIDEEYFAGMDFEDLALQYIPVFSHYSKEIQKDLLRGGYLEEGTGENMLRIFLTDNVEQEYYDDDEN